MTANFKQWRAFGYRLSQVGLVIAGPMIGIGTTIADNGTALHTGVMVDYWVLVLGGGLVGLLVVIISWLGMVVSRRASALTRANASLQMSQQRLQHALEGSSLALWDYDIAKDEIYFSEQMASILGWEVAPFVMPRPEYAEYFHPEDAERVHAVLKAVIAGDIPSFNATYRVRIQDGSWKWLRSFGKITDKDANGKSLRLTGTLSDITMQRKMQQALVQSQATLNTIVEHIPAMVFLKRADDLSYALINEAGEEILEYDRDEVLGKADYELFTPEQADAMVAIDREVLASQHAVILPETKFCSRSGWIRYLYTVKTALYDEQGQATHLLGISIDISERKLAEKKLKNSERLLNEAQQIAKLGNWTLDVIDHEVKWSNELFHILGLSPVIDEASRENFFSRVHPEDIARLKDSERRAFAEGAPHSLDVRIVRPDDEIRWVHIEAEASVDENGRPKRLAGTLQDITARKLAEQAVEDSEARLRTILETAVDSIIIIDSNGIIESANPATEGVFGYTIEEMLGNNISMLMPEPDRSAHDSYLQDYQDTNKARIIGIGREVVGLRKDGSTFPMDLAVSEVCLDGKRFYTGFVRDVSQRKQAEIELVTAKEQAEQASRAKSDFLSSMSHELRTPMNAILGFAQLLEAAEPPLSLEQHQDVKEIMIAGRHLLELINQLLDLARIEVGHMQVSLEPVPVQAILDECMQMIEPFLIKQEVSLQPLRADAAVTMVMADRIRLRQVMLNLLSNAVKYNKPGGNITVSVQQQTNGNIRIEVEDTGMGIAPEYFEELFGAFSRLGAENSEIEGTGIGLAITRQLVELMHGEIGASSQPGIGSIFWLELPGAEMSQLPPSTEVAGDAVEQIMAPGDASNTILYIEDNPANLRFMEQLLSRRADVKLITACEPQQGLDMAREIKPDLILLDIHLPEMDGFEVLRRLQAVTATRDIPVIAVSANAMAVDIEKARRAGFSDYCTKPIDIGVFMQTLDTILDSDTRDCATRWS